MNYVCLSFLCNLNHTAMFRILILNTLPEDKYRKVKKYYFDKDAQVQQLQNTLAHQRLSQSRTSLDDNEYSNRFQRLDGAINNLAFNIRRDWRSIPALACSSCQSGCSNPANKGNDRCWPCLHISMARRRTVRTLLSSLAGTLVSQHSSK